MVSFKHCRYEREKDFMVIYLTNPNVICSPGELRLELVYLFERFCPRMVHIDFSHVTYCSREAINDLMTARRRLLSRGGELVIRGLNPGVRTKFRSLRLEGNVFDMLPESSSEPEPGEGQMSAAHLN